MSQTAPSFFDADVCAAPAVLESLLGAMMVGYNYTQKNYTQTETRIRPYHHCLEQTQADGGIAITPLPIAINNGDISKLQCE